MLFKILLLSVILMESSLGFLMSAFSPNRLSTKSDRTNFCLERKEPHVNNGINGDDEENKHEQEKFHYKVKAIQKACTPLLGLKIDHVVEWDRAFACVDFGGDQYRLNVLWTHFDRLEEITSYPIDDTYSRRPAKEDKDTLLRKPGPDYNCGPLRGVYLGKGFVTLGDYVYGSELWASILFDFGDTCWLGIYNDIDVDDDDDVDDVDGWHTDWMPFMYMDDLKYFEIWKCL